METLTRLVTESLARHGFDRPLDYRRLQWSRWFRCESHHSLLSVPSKPGVFALAEEVVDFGPGTAARATDASSVQRSGASAPVATVEERRLSAASGARNDAALPAMSPEPAIRRMLAVTQFFEDDDMAFVLDRMLSFQNPMRTRLASGRYFVRYVVIEDASQRRSICAALNQWIVSSAEKVTGIGAHFATSLELAPEGNQSGAPHSSHEPSRRVSPIFRDVGVSDERSESVATNRPAAASSNSSLAAPQLDSGAATNIHCPSPFPSGF